MAGCSHSSMHMEFMSVLQFMSSIPFRVEVSYSLQLIFTEILIPSFVSSEKFALQCFQDQVPPNSVFLGISVPGFIQKLVWGPIIHLVTRTNHPPLVPYFWIVQYFLVNQGRALFVIKMSTSRVDCMRSFYDLGLPLFDNRALCDSKNNEHDFAHWRILHLKCPSKSPWTCEPAVLQSYMRTHLHKHMRVSVHLFCT